MNDEIEKELRALCHKISGTNNCLGVRCESCPLNTETDFKLLLVNLPRDPKLCG